MSLINQMLKDLDARRGPASQLEAAALEGMGLATQLHTRSNTVLFRTAVAVALILAGILLQLGYQAWSVKSRVASTQSADKAIPVIVDQTTDSTAHTPVSVPDDNPLTPPTLAQTVHNKTKTVSPLVTESDPAPVSAHTENLPGETPVKEIAVVHVRKTLTPIQQSKRSFARAQKLLARGDLRQAMQALRTVLELNAGDAPARMQLATLYYRKNRTADARQLLAEGHLLDPSNADIAIMYAQLMADAGDYQSALETIDESLKQGTTGPEVFALAASLHYQLKQFGRAASRYRDALSRQPGQGIWWMGLAVTLEHDQQPGQALDAYRTSESLLQDNALQAFVAERIATLSELKE